MTTKAQTKSLAVAYHAYHEARQNDDHNGVVVWGEMLKEAQEATGVELTKDWVLDDLIARARRLNQTEEG